MHATLASGPYSLDEERKDDIRYPASFPELSVVLRNDGKRPIAVTTEPRIIRLEKLTCNDQIVARARRTLRLYKTSVEGAAVTNLKTLKPGEQVEVMHYGLSFHFDEAYREVDIYSLRRGSCRFTLAYVYALPRGVAAAKPADVALADIYVGKVISNEATVPVQ